MGKNSAIGWTHHTFNPWWGCEKPLVQIGDKTVVSPECLICYAEKWDSRCGGRHWGKTAPRRTDFSESHWNDPVRWNREAEQLGERRRVFCLSMGDILEDRRDLDALRLRTFRLAQATPWLDWMFLTKRADQLQVLVPDWVWWLPNVWPGVTAGVQPTAELRLPFLVALKRRFPHLVAWVSGEPLLGPVNLRPYLSSLDLVIVGGESGAGARLMNIDWVRPIRDDCQRAGVSFFFKQWGGLRPKDGGDELDGRQWQEIPKGAAATA